MRFLAVFLFCVIVTTADRVSYENYKVFQIIVKSDDQIEFIEKLVEYEDGYTFWDDTKTTVMVAPTKLHKFLQKFSEENIKVKLIHKNVQTLINHQTRRLKRSTEFSWTQYHTQDEIYSWLEDLSKKYSGTVKTLVAGRSYEGRNIEGIQISCKKNNPGIFIECGLHSRDWSAVATATYVINELLTSKDASVRKMAESYDWYIFPTFNPDGYVYTHTTDRLWRKNRFPTSTSCYGVDLNRNWDDKWASKLNASDDPCSGYYAGKHPFSELETKTTSQFIGSIASKLFAYLSFFAPAGRLMIPYAFTTAHLDNYQETSSIGQKVVNALAQRNGTKYIFGTFAEALYPASGVSIDWVKSTLKLPIVFMYEFQSRGYGPLLPPEYIIPTGQEVMDSLVVLFDEARKLGYPK